MRFVLVLCPLLVAAPSLAGDNPYGLSRMEAARIAEQEAAFEALYKRQASAFRLLRDLEDLPGQKGGSLPVSLREAGPGAGTNFNRAPDGPPTIAILHDPRNGRPVDNCEMPCIMRMNPRTLAMLTIYRYGSEPVSLPAFEFDERGRPIRQPTRLEIPLGYNAVDAMANRKACREESEARLDTTISADADPCFRVPPRMPAMAERSGHCKVVFTALADGETADVVARECTDTVFCDSAALSVSRWHYYPKIELGEFVERPDIETKISFRLTETDGSVIPEPTGDLIPCIGIG